jgi:hypothetical protein
VTSTEARLARIRGRALAKTHNARTIAALASNPGCARRAILDAAGVDKQRLAAYAGFPAPFGQSRVARIDDLLDLLPDDLTFDLDPDGAGVPRRGPAGLAGSIRQVDARYAPECLSTCEMCFFCRDEARGCTAALGRDAREELGGVEHVATVLRLARGARVTDDLAEAAELLRTAARLRAETLGEAS